MAHGQVDGGGDQAESDVVAGVQRADEELLGEFHEADDRDDGRVLEEGDEVVGDAREADAQRLGQEHAPQGQGRRQAEGHGRLGLPARDGLEPGPEVLGLVGGVVEAEGQHGGGPGWQIPPQRLRQAEVDEVQLQQQRCAPEHLDVDQGRPAQGRGAVASGQGQPEPAGHGQGHGGEGDPQGGDGGLKQDGQVAEARCEAGLGPGSPGPGPGRGSGVRTHSEGVRGSRGFGDLCDPGGLGDPGAWCGSGSVGRDRGGWVGGQARFVGPGFPGGQARLGCVPEVVAPVDALKGAVVDQFAEGRVDAGQQGGGSGRRGDGVM